MTLRIKIKNPTEMLITLNKIYFIMALKENSIWSKLCNLLIAKNTDEVSKNVQICKNLSNKVYNIYGVDYKLVV